MCDHHLRRSCCCNWQAFAWSSKEDRVDSQVKRCGGRTVMSELSVEPSLKSGHLDRASALFVVPST